MNTSQEHVAHRRIIYGVTVGKSAFALLRGQLKWLQDEGWQVTLVTSPDEASRAAADREGVELRSIRMTRSISPAADLVALIRWMLLVHRIRPSAVNVSTPKAGLLGGLAAFVLRVPRRLYVVRGLRLEGSRGLTARILWFTEWLTMRLATDVLFVSASLATEADRRRLLNPRKSWMIGAGSSNGVDAHAVAARVDAADSGAMRRELGLGPHDFVVGFIGRIAHDKGVATLLEAFSNIESSQVRLLVIGSTEDEALNEKVKSLGNRVRRIPWTDDVWSHLSVIDVLCLPTHREGFPNVVLEAAAAAIPTITTRATGAVDSVVDGDTGLLIDVGDSEALTAAIQLCVEHPADAQRMGAAARRRVLANFQPEQIWQGVSEILVGDNSPQFAYRFTSTVSKKDIV